MKKASPIAGLTLAAYAAAKHLSVAFLKRLGLREVYLSGTPAVAIPYRDTDGEELGVRFRLSIDSENRFRWRNGSKLSLYGLWQMSKFLEKKYIFIPEGESDSQTLWFHDVPAFGLPGANSWKEEWAGALDGFERIYVAIEPDKGGEAVLRWLERSKIRDRVRLVKLEGAKDVSELFLADRQGFRSALKAALKAAQAWPEYEKAVMQERNKVLWNQSKTIARNEDILEHLAEDLAAKGMAGESLNSELIYLCVTTRLLPKPVSLGVKGPSSGGKNYTVGRTLEYFPADAFYMLTGMSERALAYSDEPLSHRFVVLAEAAALAGDFMNYLLRSLLSEGRLVYETVEKVGGKLCSRRIEREGPTGLLVTTTAIALHPENETRFFSIRIDDSPKQTSRVLAAEACKVSHHASAESANAESSLEKWRAFQQWLAASARPVIVPYADALAVLIPPVAVRLRRDFKAILSLIQAHALLHLVSRETDDQGYIVATLADYASVRALVHSLVMEGVERGVSRRLRETVSAVEYICAEKGGFQPVVTVSELAKHLGLDVSTALRRVHECLRRDLLRTDGEITTGRRMQLKVGEVLPENQEILPTVEDIVKHGKSRGKKFE
jgi:hypothetical protein